jgi:hypothetical protein
VITVKRDEVVADGGGSCVYAKCTFQLPRSFSGAWPVLLIDVVARDLPDNPSVQAQQLAVPAPLAGEPYRPTLEEVHALLGRLARTVVEELAPVAFPPIIARSRRQRLLAWLRLRQKLELIGPNFNVTPVRGRCARRCSSRTSGTCRALLTAPTSSSKRLRRSAPMTVGAATTSFAGASPRFSAATSSYSSRTTSPPSAMGTRRVVMRRPSLLCRQNRGGRPSLTRARRAISRMVATIASL